MNHFTSAKIYQACAAVVVLWLLFFSGDRVVKDYLLGPRLSFWLLVFVFYLVGSYVSLEWTGGNPRRSVSIRTHPRYHHLHQNSVDESGNASGMSGAGSSTGGIGGAVGGIGINLGSPSSVMSSELGGVALCSFTDQFWEKARAQISPRVQAWLNRKLKAKITKYVKLPDIMGEPELTHIEFGDPLSLKLGNLVRDVTTNEYSVDVSYDGRGSLILSSASRMMVSLSQIELLRIRLDVNNGQLSLGFWDVPSVSMALAVELGGANISTPLLNNTISKAIDDALHKHLVNNLIPIGRIENWFRPKDHSPPFSSSSSASAASSQDARQVGGDGGKGSEAQTPIRIKIV